MRDGLTLTVQPTTSTEITAAANGNGITLDPHRLSTGNFGIAINGQTSILQNSDGNGNVGISLSNRGSGAASVTIAEGVQIGSADSRWNEQGVYAWSAGTSTGDLSLVNNGSIYSTQHGIRLNYNSGGTGDATITNNGLVDSSAQGLYTWHGGSGNVQITNAGTVRSDGHGIEGRQAGTGDLTIRHNRDGRISSGGWGIFARKDGTGGAIDIRSWGDIEESTIGIHVDNRASSSTDNTEVRVLGGTIFSSGSGIQLGNRSQGDVTIELGAEGSIGTEESRVGGLGITASFNNGGNGRLNILNAGSIFSRSIGVSASHSGTGNIDIDLRGGSIVNSWGHRGISASHTGSGNVVVTNRGRIQSWSHGIFTYHNGTGNIRVDNRGEITNTYGHSIRAFRNSAGQINIEQRGSLDSLDHAIFARHDGPGTSGGITINSYGNIITRGYRRAGIQAEVRDPDTFGDLGTAQSGTAPITVTHHSGIIESYRGIVVVSGRFSGSTHGSPVSDYSSGTQPALRIRVLGGTIRAIVPTYDPNLNEARSEHQAGWVMRKYWPRSNAAAGVWAGTGDLLRIAEFIAAGDRPSSTPTDLSSLITDEVRQQFREVLQAAIEFQSAQGSEIPLGDLYDPRSLIVGSDVTFNPGTFPDLSTDDLLDQYLTANDGYILLRFLEHTMSSEEKALFEAIWTKTGLDAAIDALPSDFSQAYKDRARWYADAYNNGNIDITIGEGGMIVSEGDGIRSTHILEQDRNGDIDVEIEEGAVVMARRYGIYATGAGLDDRGTPGDESDDVRNQRIRIDGRVVSTSGSGAGIYLDGGGYVTVGSTGYIIAASGIIIHAGGMSPVILVLELAEDEELLDGFRRIQGRIVGNPDHIVITVNNFDGTETFVYEGGTNRRPDGALEIAIVPTADGLLIRASFALVARVYEVLPSMLLEVNGLVTYQTRTNALHDESKWWISTTAEAGSREPAESTSSAAYDYNWYGVSTGTNFSMDNEDVIGVYASQHIGKSKVSGSSEIDASATSIGLSYTRNLKSAYIDYIDLGVAATNYKFDVDSSSSGSLASGRSATGFALQLEAGAERQFAGREVKLHAGVIQSKVKVKNFIDKQDLDASSISGKKLVGYFGARIDKKVGGGTLFGTFKLESEIDSKSSVVVDGSKLVAQDKGLKMRFGGGKTWVTATNGLPITASASYGTGRNGSDFKAGLSISF